MLNKLAIVVPCYNEEEVLPLTTKVLKEILIDLTNKEKISEDSYILFVNDGSRDQTWNLIENEHYKDEKHIKGVKLAKNVGHQYALTAGLLTAMNNCDLTISIDADLQDDVNVIEDMIDQYLQGKDIVYGVRNDRKKDSFFKRHTAQLFYKIMSFMGVKTIYNHADFRLMSKRAVNQFSQYNENNLFIRGIVTTIGYETGCVYYERQKRAAGESKYPFSKMLALAVNGITSFSIKPIQLIFSLGLIIVCGCIIAAIYALFSYFSGNVVKGWTSLILSIWFLGGVQLLSIGLVGQYIGKIYIEVKNRPRYNIEKIV